MAFRVIAGNTHPDHTCISEFRRIHLEALAKRFVQVLRLCHAAGLVKLGHVALDGTKVKANASKHKAMSYQRMKQEEERLGAKVQALLQAAEQADAHEDAQYGRGRGEDLPEELRRAESRRHRIRELREQLEAEARVQKEAEEAEARKAAEANADEERSGQTPLPSHQIPRRRTERRRIRRSATSPTPRVAS